MKKPDLNKIVDQVTTGHPEQRLAAARAALALLYEYLRWLATNLRRQREDFRRALEAWDGRYIHEEIAPYALQQDVDQGRKIRLYAWVAMFAELGLTFFMALTFSVPVLFALTMAVVAIYVTKAIMMALWSNKLRPQDQIHRLRKFIIAPFGLFMLGSLAILLLAQRSAGGLLLLLAGLLNASLFGVGFGLLMVASGLLCYSEAMLWSQRAELRYRQLYTEAAEANKVYEYVQRVIRELTPPAPPVITAPPAAPDFLNGFGNSEPRRAKALVRAGAPLLLGFVLLSSACQGVPVGSVTPNIETPAAAAPVPIAATEMRVLVDGSFSNHPQMLADAVKHLLHELAQVVESQHITRFVSFYFGRDGWAATKTLELDLPTPRTTERSEPSEVFGRLRDEQKAGALKNYRAELHDALKNITATQLLPPAGTPEPPCTDLNGVFANLTATRSNPHRLVVLISDGHENCAAALRPVKLPSQTRLIIVLLPEDTAKAGGQPQYLAVEARRQQLQQAVPQALIVMPDEKLLEVLGAGKTE